MKKYILYGLMCFYAETALADLNKSSMPFTTRLSDAETHDIGVVTTNPTPMYQEIKTSSSMFNRGRSSSVSVGGMSSVSGLSNGFSTSATEIVAGTCIADEEFATPNMRRASKDKDNGDGGLEPPTTAPIGNGEWAAAVLATLYGLAKLVKARKRQLIPANR